MPSRGSSNHDGFVPTVQDGFLPVDGRQTHRCVPCGAYVEYRDKAKHRAYHMWIADIAGRIAKLETPQETLFEPPF